MTRIRKMFTKEMLMEQINQVLINKDEDDVPLLKSEVVKSNTEETEKKHRKRKKESTEETSVKKQKQLLEWKPEDCAHAIGKLTKFTGDGGNKKCHYEKFEFHGVSYALEDTVLLVPEDENRKPYVAIIKDIYIQGEEGYVKLEVQWFYRPEDVEKKHVGNWESKDSRDLFYSFHRDEVFAESVKHSCIVHFVPKNMQIPNRRDHPGFIVQNVYNTDKKKLCKFTNNSFNEQQKHGIELLVAKTVSRVGDLFNIEKEQMTMKPRRKQYVPKRFIMRVEEMSPESSNMVKSLKCKSILEKFDMLTGDSNRDNNLEELLEAVKEKCRLTKKKQASDYDTFWPDDAVPMLRALEEALYDSLAKDIPKYNHNLEVLVDKLKNSRMLAERVLTGELKPEQIVTMTPYELAGQSGHTFNEITAVIEEPIMKTDDPSTSKSGRRRDFLED